MKYIKDLSYQKMSLIKAALGSPIFIFFNEKKSERFGQFLTQKNYFENQNCAKFDIQYQIEPIV